MGSNAAKTAQLGMPHGTATSQLRKMILFDVLKRHGENQCFQCEQEILTVEELSIEHKLPWLHVNTALFWDLENIAFSHLRCNIADHRMAEGSRASSARQRRVAPEGQAWCSKCKRFKPKAEFSPKPARWNGVHPECRSCKTRWGVTHGRATR